ncbi:DUF3467 domain-containing protein [Actinokineospora terrae]|uniref:DUF3467 domain-containing protein n=1 Tax=Actinokineospora terrae TaxID=155974 RepID=A0A1H9WT37_9PSEU|nr:DUF3467 domain-containing protein [Actinokineospora terrae]SES37100.1 Protein of unknown function [Actinokineospora terrae]
MDQPLESRFMVNMPPEQEVGHYANFAVVWHDKESFVLDFATIVGPNHPAQDDSGTEFLATPARIVSRVRIPPSQVFEIMKALEQQLSKWEQETGRKPLQ